MKKRLFALLLAAALLTALAGCGKSESSLDANGKPGQGGGITGEESVAAPGAPVIAPDFGGDRGKDGLATTNIPAPGTNASINAEKIVYSGNARVETVDFEKTIEGVYQLIEQYGGFLESSSIDGVDYVAETRGYPTTRRANFVIRVPGENFEELNNSLSTLGNVTYTNTSAQNISASYYDVQSRLTAFQTQETRLLEMLEIAETVEDMLAIQQQLTEVQYTIDSLQSTLRNYDNMVNYSSVSLSVEEVVEYSDQPVITRTYWEKLSAGFAESLKSVGRFFTNLSLFFLANLPVLLLVAAGLVIFFLILRSLFKNNGEARRQRRERRAAKKAARIARRSGGAGTGA